MRSPFLFSPAKLLTLATRILLFVGLIVICSNQANALVQVPTFRLGLGYSKLKLDVGQFKALPINSMMTLNPMFLWDLPGLRSRIGPHFLADMGSSLGFISGIGVGATFLFYPLGLSSGRELKTDSTEFIKTRISPYMQLQFTPMKSTYNIQSTGSNPVYVSLLVYETSIGGGVDYPLNDDFVLFGGLHYRFAAFTAQETTVGATKYSGPMLLLGVMTNFY